MNKLTTSEKQYLAPLNAFEKSQKLLVKDNPFIEITDNESFELAKKSRTALLKGRTALQNQQTSINKTVNSLKDLVKTETEKLIAITSPAEEKQQVEVKRYENIKETERIEREKAREEKETKIRGQIDEIITDFEKEIHDLEFDKMTEFKESMEEFFNKVDTSKFEDLEIYFSGQLAVLNTKLDGKCSELQKDHDLMVANQQNEWFSLRNTWNEDFMNVTAETIGVLVTDFDTKIPAINSDDFGTFGDNFVQWSKKMRDLIGNKQIELQKEVDRIKEEKKQEEHKKSINQWFEAYELLVNEMKFDTIVSVADQISKAFDILKEKSLYVQFKELIDLKIQRLEVRHKTRSEIIANEKIKSDKEEKDRLAKEKADKKKTDATEKARQKKLKPLKEKMIKHISMISNKTCEATESEVDEIMTRFFLEIEELKIKYTDKINEL